MSEPPCDGFLDETIWEFLESSVGEALINETVVLLSEGFDEMVNEGVGEETDEGGRQLIDEGAGEVLIEGVGEALEEGVVNVADEEIEAQAMPAVVASRPQSTEQMFQALKRHILKERQKKKQEQEADAEVERQRKERELQQKQDVMTLEENREQLAQLEQTLAKLKDEKHQLFVRLKKVLHEDDNRRRRQQETAAAAAAATTNSNEVVELYGMYPNVTPIMSSGHLPGLVMQSSNYPPMANRENMYKVPSLHTLLPPSGSLKRPRSPSPPPQMSYPNYSQKAAPPPPPSRLTYQKSSNYNYYHHNPGPTTVTPAQPTYSYSQPYVASSSRSEVPHQESQSSKHPMYLNQPMSRGSLNQAYIHSTLDHPKIGYSEDKYYPVAAVRPATHVPLHGGAIPIQQPAQGTKTGGITSGYPIRPPSSNPPPPHLTPVSNTTHGMYVSQQASSSRLVYSQAGLPTTRFIQQRR